MKPIALIILLLCNFLVSAQDNFHLPCPTIDPLYTTAITKQLSSDYFEGRDLSRKSISKSTNYLINILKNNKLLPFHNDYLHTFNIKDDLNSDNILCYINKNPQSKDVILLVANYDNLGKRYENIYTDSIYNGANDNATGVTTVFQLGQFFNSSCIKENFILAFTTGRQYGYSGVGKVIQEIKDRGYNIKFAINFERLGIPLTKNNHRLILYEAMPSNLSQILDTLDPAGYLDVQPFQNTWLDMSQTEHGLMYNLLKVPTFTITSFNYLNDPSFMTPNDEFENLDIEFLQQSISFISETLFYFLTTETPITLLKPDYKKP